MASNIELQAVIDYTLANVRGAPLTDVLGIQNEPALSICNDVYQETLQRPLTWRFNKANCAGTGLGILYFTTIAFQQDYPLTNATARTASACVHISTVFNNGLVVAGGVGTVLTNWAHGFTAGQQVTHLNIGQWSSANIFVPDTSGNINGTFTIVSVPTPTSYTFATAATAGTYGAPGINDIGWVERCVLEDFLNTSNVKPRHSIEVTMNLELESIVQPPFKISYQYATVDTGLAANALVASYTATFRLWPVPSAQIWGIMADYQMKPVTFTDLGQTWGVWPDELIFVIRQGVRAMALDFVEDPRATTEYQLFQTKLDQVREIRDQERPSQTMFPDRPIMYGG
jgi:hypothetical protein